MIERGTRREREVLVLLANGLQYNEAAAVLGLQTNTIRCHTRNLKKKLCVRTTPEAVLKVMQLAV